MAKYPICNHREGTAPKIFGQPFVLCWRCTGVMLLLVLMDFKQRRYCTCSSIYSGAAKEMLNTFVKDIEHIYIACQSTDFRKQIDGLVVLVSMQFKLDPFSKSCVFIFCNKKKNSIKVLRYDNNGFILATKKLLEDLKFQWPKTPEEVKEVSDEVRRMDFIKSSCYLVL